MTNRNARWRNSGVFAVATALLVGKVWFGSESRSFEDDAREWFHKAIVAYGLSDEDGLDRINRALSDRRLVPQGGALGVEPGVWVDVGHPSNRIVAENGNWPDGRPAMLEWLGQAPTGRELALIVDGRVACRADLSGVPLGDSITGVVFEADRVRKIRVDPMAGGWARRRLRIEKADP